MHYKLDNVKKYLEAMGWKIEAFNKTLDKANLELDKKTFEVFLPNREDFIDYNEMIKILLGRLSEIENRPSFQIGEDIKGAGGENTIKIKITGKKFSDGKIPLIYFSEAIQNIKDTLIYEACSQINPKSKYGRPYSEARQLLDNCEFERLEHGSIIVDIKVPSNLDIKSSKTQEEREKLNNLGTKTIIGLISGINAVESLPTEQITAKNLNKNVCEAISKLLGGEQEKLSLGIEANFDVASKIENKPKVYPTITSSEHYQKFVDLAKKLSEAKDEGESVIKGVIIKLQWESELEDGKRQVVIYSKERKKRIYIFLNKDEYQEACDFHRDKKQIEISGDLSKAGTRWVLNKPHDFKSLN